MTFSFSASYIALWAVVVFQGFLSLALLQHLAQVKLMLASAEPQVQEMLGTNLLQRYIDEKEFDRAREQLNEFADRDQYPYDAATELVLAFPEERSADRSAVFSQVLKNFMQHSGESRSQFEDLSTLIFRSWRKLPSPMVLEAIDQILQKAKQADEALRGIRINISTNRGDVYFASQYTFRLFQLMPVIRELDESLSEKLVHENDDVQAALQLYPQGLGSIDPGVYRDTPSGKAEMPGIQSIGVVTANDVAEAAAEQVQNDINRRHDQILMKAQKDPKQALADAVSLPLNSPLLPENSPRAVTLHLVARIAATRDPSVSRMALQEMRKLMDKMSLRNQAQILADSPEIYLQLGDEDEARKSLNELVTMAGKLFGRDSDLSDPNEAFKGMWPSANLWRRCIQFAAKLTPSPAEDIIAEIPDAEIKSFERVVFATSLLGASTPPLSIIEKHKNGGSVFIVP